MVTGKWETAAGKGGDGREATTPHDHTTTGRGGREGGRDGGELGKGGQEEERPPRPRLVSSAEVFRFRVKLCPAPNALHFEDKY